MKDKKNDILKLDEMLKMYNIPHTLVHMPQVHGYKLGYNDPETGEEALSVIQHDMCYFPIGCGMVDIWGKLDDTHYPEDSVVGVFEAAAMIHDHYMRTCIHN